VTTCPAGTLCYKLLESWANAVTEASGGRLVVEHYGPGEIVTEVDFMEATAQRIVEVTSGDYSKGGEFPVGAPYASMPMGISLMEWGVLDLGVLEPGIGREFLQEKVYGPIGIKYLGGIPQHGNCINSSRPIEKLSDIKGMKIRDFGLKGEFCAKLGFTVTYIPFPEVYLAISTGVVEGQNQLHSNIIDLSFYEVAPYITLPDTVPYLGAGCWLNMEAWNELPEDLQKLVMETFEAFSYRFARDQVDRESSALAEFVERGGTIFYLPEEDIEFMKQTAVEVWDEAAAKDPLSAEFIAIYKDFMIKHGYEIPS
jgi:TRAP-type C4-dicarboxylate transport system substrate-binding protein